jgi:hypothetical protein
VSIPLSSSDIDPFNYTLNSAQLLKLVTADFVSKRFPMYFPYYLHLCGWEKLLGIGCFDASSRYGVVGRTEFFLQHRSGWKHRAVRVLPHTNPLIRL